jgi:hypothetical protein
VNNYLKHHIMNNSKSILREPLSTPPPMADEAYKRMVKINHITPEAITALASSIERGKELIQSAKVCIENSRRIL